MLAQVKVPGEVERVIDFYEDTVRLLIRCDDESDWRHMVCISVFADMVKEEFIEELRRQLRG